MIEASAAAHRADINININITALASDDTQPPYRYVQCTNNFKKEE
jgi:hypothetical protein